MRLSKAGDRSSNYDSTKLRTVVESPKRSKGSDGNYNIKMTKRNQI